MAVSIYTVYHKESHIIKNSCIVPIQVGNDTSISDIKYRDNQGDNISLKNESFCELTAIYWAWKNDQTSEHIGLMHYRRYFDFNNNHLKLPVSWGNFEYSFFDYDFIQNFGLLETKIQNTLAGADIILPTKWDVREAGLKTLRDHYANAEHHFKKDLDLACTVIQEFYPEYSEHIRELDKPDGYFTNMFIMSRPYFENYCSWLFNILFEVEKRLDISAYTIQEKRVFGYLSERLLNIWLASQKKKTSNLIIKEIGRVFIKDTSRRRACNAPNKTDKEKISIVFTCDNNYVHCLGALLASIIANSNQNYFYDFIVFDGGISNENKLKFDLLIRGSNSGITFVDFTDEFKSYKVHMHFTRATFYRLILSDIITDRSRILYMDCDMIALDDLSKIFFLDMEGKPVAAVADYIMEHFCAAEIPIPVFIGNKSARQYLDESLNIDPFKYFQAGFMLIDLERFKSLISPQVLVDDLKNNCYWFLDQDVINKHLNNQVKFIPTKWNIANCSLSILQGISQSTTRDFSSAELNPGVIHYAGQDLKPWINNNAKWSDFYFYYLSKTPWFCNYWLETSVSSLKKEKSGKNFFYRATRRLWHSRLIPWQVKRVFISLRKPLMKILS